MSRLAPAVLLLALLGLTAHVCAFKVQDPDYWWHVKTGEIMLRTHALVSSEPFAYTRPGQPFSPRFEWLSQVTMHLIDRAAGPTGIILWRTAMSLLVFLLLLAIDPGRVWPNALLAMLGVVAARPGLVERPQLFSYAIFSAMLLMAFRLLGSSRKEVPRRLLFGFVLLEVLWVNLHGAVSLLGFVALAALLAQRLPGALADERRSWAWMAGLMLLAFFVSPLGPRNLDLVGRVLTDRSAGLLSEWAARPAGPYLRDLGVFWLAALAALWWGGRARVFCAALLAVTGVLSLLALRHEVFFLCAAMGVVFFQLRHFPGGGRFLGRSRVLPFAAAALLVWTAWAVRSGDRAIAAAGLQGYGVSAPARGAADFLERNHITGRMFNTLELGGYLEYRGYPERQVFIDGRNWDHGPELMRRTWLAGMDAAAWKELEERYGLSYAVIGYDSLRSGAFIPYCAVLGADPRWKLVYLDDWTAVYLKDLPSNRAVIARDAYRVLTPELLGSTGVEAARKGELERELRRAAGGESQSRKAARVLARLKSSTARPLPRGHVQRGLDHARAGRLGEARAELSRALAEDPGDVLALESMAAVCVQEGRWEEALGFDEEAARRDPRDSGPHADMARVLSRLGRCSQAADEARKAGALGKDISELLRAIDALCVPR